MAEIEIQRKKRPLWPWIIGAIAIILVLWLIINSMNKKYDEKNPENNVIEGDAGKDAAMEKRLAQAKELEKYPGQIVPFLHFALNDEVVESGQNQHYISQGLHQLTQALHFIIDRNGNNPALVNKAEVLMTESRKIDQNQGSTLQSGYTRNAFIVASEVLDELQKKNYPGMEAKVANVRQAAELIDANKPVAVQQSGVKSFFTKTAEVIEEMGKDLKM